MSWTTVDADVALEVGGHEAIIRQGYKDSIGRWTWSVGLTSATGHNVERYIDNPQPLEHCLRIYVWALDKYADAVRETFEGIELTKEQFTAALSFHWNTGAIKKASWVKHFIAGDYVRSEAAFMQWKNPPEIVERRKKEANLLFRGVWSNNGTMTEYGVTKNHTPAWATAKRVDVRQALNMALGQIGAVEVVVDQAPQPDAPVIPSKPPLKPLAQSKEILNGATQVATGTGGLLVALSQLDKTVQIVIIAGCVIIVVSGLIIFGNRLIARFKGQR